MDITIYHTRDVEKISELISLTVKTSSKGSHSVGRPFGEILHSTVENDDFKVKFIELCPSEGYGARPRKEKKVFRYFGTRVACVRESLDPDFLVGQHLGTVVTDILAVYEGSAPVKKGSRTNQGLKVSYGHLDFMLVEFDENKASYRMITDFFNVRLGISPDKVSIDELEDYKERDK
jgi:hypothetical protein